MDGCKKGSSKRAENRKHVGNALSHAQDAFSKVNGICLFGGHFLEGVFVPVVLVNGEVPPLGSSLNLIAKDNSAWKEPRSPPGGWATCGV